MECYCVASKKPIRHEKSKPQRVIVIVCGFEDSMHNLAFILVRQYIIIVNLIIVNKIKSLHFLDLHSKITPNA